MTRVAPDTQPELRLSTSRAQQSRRRHSQSDNDNSQPYLPEGRQSLLALAVVTLIFCNLPLGIFSVVLACLSQRNNVSEQRAQLYRTISFALSLISILLGVTTIAVVCFIFTPSSARNKADQPQKLTTSNPPVPSPKGLIQKPDQSKPATTSEMTTQSQLEIVSASWGYWTTWGQCTRTCNNGTTIRRRACLAKVRSTESHNSQYGTLVNMAVNVTVCTGRASQLEQCGTTSCSATPTATAMTTMATTAIWTAWAEWSQCSAPCGNNVTRYRQSTCQANCNSNQKQRLQTERCRNVLPCQAQFCRYNGKNGYTAVWQFNSTTGVTRFTIRARVYERSIGQSADFRRWTGIGFSHDQRMAGTDVILGVADGQGGFRLQDTWIPRANWRSGFVIDIVHRGLNLTGYHFDDEFVEFNFSRIYDPAGGYEDIELGQCIYLMFPEHGGAITEAGYQRHPLGGRLPAVRGPVCLYNCP